MASNHTEPYREMLKRLRDARIGSGFTQVDVAKALGKHQSYVSKCESGERRLDPLELIELLALYKKPLEAVLPCALSLTGQNSGPNVTISSNGHLQVIEIAVRELEAALDSGTDPHDIGIAQSLAEIQKAIRDFAEAHYLDDHGSQTSGMDRIRRFLIAHVGDVVDGEILEVVGAIGEWARRIRELRHEKGGMTISTGMNSAGLRLNQYRLENLDVVPEWKRMKAKVFTAVLKRDDYRCTSCGWSPKEGPSQGRRFLEVNHKKQVKHGGKPVAANLETLCNKCHDALDV